MNFLKKKIQSFQSDIAEIQKKGKEVFTKIEQKFQEKLLTSETSIEQDLIQIHGRLYWMDFPHEEKILRLSKYLNENFDQQYYIWNISEVKYDPKPFNTQVADHNWPGYPNPSLEDIFVICISVISWLESDPGNIAIIHCQNTRGRSALIASCILCLNKTFTHPGEALTFFCKQTLTKDAKILFPSQQLYLNYFSNVLNSVKLNPKPLKLKKIIFSEIPTILNEDKSTFRPYLQVFQNSNILFNSLNQGKVFTYSENDISLWFDLEGVEVYEDILFRCKQYVTNQVRQPVFRFLIHTSFTHDNVIRLLKTDIDFAQNIHVSDNFFIDIIFEESENNQNIKKQINLESIVQECKRKIESKQKNVKREDEQKQQEIQNILSNNNQNVPNKTNENKTYGIGDSENEIKIKKSEDQEEEEEVKNNSPQKSNKNEEILNKLINESPKESDDQDIDDYLENLEKSV